MSIVRILCALASQSRCAFAYALASRAMRCVITIWFDSLEPSRFAHVIRHVSPGPTRSSHVTSDVYTTYLWYVALPGPTRSTHIIKCALYNSVVLVTVYY